MSKIDKTQAMATIGQDFAVISAAKTEVHNLEKTAAAAIAQVVKDHGPGPHKMPLPDGTVLVATFRKDGDRFNVSAIPFDSIT
jgi:hypothetical protein